MVGSYIQGSQNKNFGKQAFPLQEKQKEVSRASGA